MTLSLYHGFHLSVVKWWKAIQSNSSQKQFISPVLKALHCLPYTNVLFITFVCLCFRHSDDFPNLDYTPNFCHLVASVPGITSLQYFRHDQRFIHRINSELYENCIFYVSGPSGWNRLSPSLHECRFIHLPLKISWSPTCFYNRNNMQRNILAF